MEQEPQKDQRDAAEQRRAKIVGRVVVIGMGLLVLAYLIPTFINRG